MPLYNEKLYFVGGPTEEFFNDEDLKKQQELVQRIQNHNKNQSYDEAYSKSIVRQFDNNPSVYKSMTKQMTEEQVTTLNDKFGVPSQRQGKMQSGNRKYRQDQEATGGLFTMAVVSESFLRTHPYFENATIAPVTKEQAKGITLEEGKSMNGNKTMHAFRDGEEFFRAKPKTFQEDELEKPDTLVKRFKKDAAEMGNEAIDIFHPDQEVTNRREAILHTTAKILAKHGERKNKRAEELRDMHYAGVTTFSGAFVYGFAQKYHELYGKAEDPNVEKETKPETAIATDINKEEKEQFRLEHKEFQATPEVDAYNQHLSEGADYKKSILQEQLASRYDSRPAPAVLRDAVNVQRMDVAKENLNKALEKPNDPKLRDKIKPQIYELADCINDFGIENLKETDQISNRDIHEFKDLFDESKLHKQDEFFSQPENMQRVLTMSDVYEQQMKQGLIDAHNMGYEFEADNQDITHPAQEAEQYRNGTMDVLKDDKDFFDRFEANPTDPRIQRELPRRIQEATTAIDQSTSKGNTLENMGIRTNKGEQLTPDNVSRVIDATKALVDHDRGIDFEAEDQLPESNTLEQEREFKKREDARIAEEGQAKELQAEAKDESASVMRSNESSNNVLSEHKSDNQQGANAGNGQSIGKGVQPEQTAKKLEKEEPRTVQRQTQQVSYRDNTEYKAVMKPDGSTQMVAINDELVQQEAWKAGEPERAKKRAEDARWRAQDEANEKFHKEHPEARKRFLEGNKKFQEEANKNRKDEGLDFNLGGLDDKTIRKARGLDDAPQLGQKNPFESHRK